MIPVTFQLEGNLQALSRAMEHYAKARRMTAEQVLTKRGQELGLKLYRQFEDLAPGPKQVWQEAEARGYRTPARNISRAAWERADAYMGGAKAIIGSVTDGLLRSVRIGKRGKRVYGGRHGRGGRAATYSEARQFRREGEGWLNRQAVATFYELSLRAAARKFLASSWLAFRWVRRARGERVLVHTNAKGQVLGRWTMQGTDDQQQLTLSSHVPGVDQFPETVNAAIAADVQDIADYFALKHRDSLAESIRASVL